MGLVDPQQLCQGTVDVRQRPDNNAGVLGHAGELVAVLVEGAGGDRGLVTTGDGHIWH